MLADTPIESQSNAIGLVAHLVYIVFYCVSNGVSMT